MSYALVRIKQGLGGLNVYNAPGGKQADWRDAIEPHGVHIQTIGTPMILKDGTDWVEVMYARPRTKPERGWIAERCVNIDWQTFKGTVHEAQEDYRKSVSFPKPPDIPHFDREFMPEIEPLISKRGFWLLVLFGGLLAVIFLAKLFFHIP